jgi:hypothetical protein
MEVWAKTLTGRTVSVWAEDGETVKSVKSKVEAAIGNAGGMQHRLFHRVGTFSFCWEDSKTVGYLPGFSIPFFVFHAFPVQDHLDFACCVCTELPQSMLQCCAEVAWEVESGDFSSEMHSHFCKSHEPYITITWEHACGLSKVVSLMVTGKLLCT